jgi:hypothetical protein
LRKVTVPAGSPSHAALDAAGARPLANYGSFAVYEATDDALANVPAGARVRDDYNLLRLRRGDLDTRAASAKAGQPKGEVSGGGADGRGLFLVQCVAPVLDDWREAAARDGLELLAPVPNNALLVRGSARSVERFAARPFVQWWGRYGVAERLDPALDGLVAGDQQAREVAVAIELTGDAAGLDLARRLEREARVRITPLARVNEFLVLRGVWDAALLASLLDLPEVINVEAWREPRPCDERVGVITAGLLDAAGVRPLGPGYLEWLASHGFGGQTFDFGIDVMDTGLDRGAVDDPRMHPDLRDQAGASRIAYARSYVEFNLPGDQAGHGTLNATIAAGYATGAGDGYQDAEGYRYGLGVAPFVRVGGSKILDDGGSTGLRLSDSFNGIAAYAYSRGMRISTNSWGLAGNRYTTESQEFDAIVRDADPETAGNQEYTVVFSAGNQHGGGFIQAPGTAKNVVTVGASENYRPVGVVDGCGIGDEGADNAGDVAIFSSGGPVNDGRNKPDLVAPGTHMQAAASQNAIFTATGLCVTEGRYFPLGQKLYSWASGTSQAAPVVAGAAALVRAYAVMNSWLPGAAPPSPAMIKALLLGATTPITGRFAGRTLPDPRQGYGRVSLGPVFDDAARVLVDERVRFAETGETHVETGHVGDPARPFRVALVWTDAPGVPAFAPQVNDLDLEVRVGDTIYRGNAYTGFESTPNPEVGSDTLNTVETVTIPAGVRGPFTVTVRAAALAGDGVPGNADALDQDFALVIYNVEDGRWPYPVPPSISSAEVRGAGASFKLLVDGEGITAETIFEINGAAVSADRIRYLERKLRWKLRGPARALGVVRGENRIVAINGDLRSEAHVFEY